MYLDYFFYYGGHLAAVLVLACAGLACWRLAKVLRDRSFVIASWALGASVALDAIHYTGNELYVLLPRQFAAKWNAASLTVYHLASACLFLFLVIFACGAIRRSLAVSKPAETGPAPAAPES